MKFFLSAGEPSGDAHAAALIEKVKEYEPAAEFAGFGSSRMREAGCWLLYDMSRLSVMWILQVFLNIKRFKKLLKSAKEYFHKEHIDAVILVDYPGFNWHIARLAAEQNIPVFYFMPPQIWSWAQWRIKKMRRFVDGVFCPLPFEYRWFQEKGCNAVYMGHPFFEEVRNKKSDAAFLESFYTHHGDGPVLTLLPGSRDSEVLANIDDMLIIVEYVRSMLPNVRPVFSPFNERQAEFIQARLKDLEISIPIFVNRTTELIRAADCCLAVSGSVSLEILACNKPTVIYYRVNSVGLFIQRFFRRSRYITLVNLLGADRFRDQTTSKSPMFYDQWVIPKEPSSEDRGGMLFPEFLTATDKTKAAAAYLIHYLSQPANLAKQKRMLSLLYYEVDQIESPLDIAAAALLDAVRDGS